MKPRLFALTLALLVVACGSQEPVLGKWTEIGKTEFIEFFKDGTVTVVDPRMHVAMSGTYSVDRGTYLLKLQIMGQMVVFKARISGGKLTLYSPDGSSAGSYQKQ